MKESLTEKRLALALLSVVIVIALAPFVINWTGHVLNAGSLLLFAVADIRFSPVVSDPDLMMTHYAHGIKTLFPALIYHIRDGWGVSYEAQLFVLTALEHVIWFLSLYLIGQTITKRPLGGFLTVGAFISGRVTQSIYGYAYPIFLPAYEGGMGLTLAIAVLSLWIYGKSWAAYVLAGALFYLHPVNAGIVSAFIIAHSLFAVAQKKRPFIEEAKKLFAFALIATPGALQAASGATSVESFDVQAFWNLMDMRKDHHIRPWKFFGSVFPFFVQALLAAASLSVLQKLKRISPDLALKVWAVLIGSAVFSVLQVVTVEVLEIPQLAGLVTTRASLFLLVMTIAVTACLLLSIGSTFSYFCLALLFFGNGASNPQNLLLIFVVFPVLYHYQFSLPKGSSQDFQGKIKVLFLLSWFAFFSLVFALFGKSAFPSWTMSFLLLAATTFLLSQKQLPNFFHQLLNAFLEKTSNLLTKIPQQAVLIALVSVLLLEFGVDRVGAVSKLKDEETRTQGYVELQNWVRSDTSIETMFLVHPTHDCAPYCISRNVLHTDAWMGSSIYVLQALEAEKKVMNVVYGLDWSDSDQVGLFKTDRYGEMSKRFYGLSNQRVEKIAQAYPKLGYVLAQKLDDSKEYLPKLDLPVVYQNNVFRVYSASR